MTDNQAGPAEQGAGRLGAWPLAIGYVAVRLLLTVAVAAVLYGISALVGLQMPILVALLLAVILQLPLSWLLLAPLRDRVTARMAEQAGERRRAREALRAALAGDEDPGDDE